MSGELFKKFLGFLERRLDDYNKLSLLVQMRYDQCSEQFRNSQSFRDLIHLLKSTIKRDPSRIYVHLQDFLAELKAYKVVRLSKKRKSELLSPAAVKVKRINLDDVENCRHLDIGGINESIKTAIVDERSQCFSSIPLEIDTINSPTSKYESVNILLDTKEDARILMKGKNRSTLVISKNIENLLHKAKDMKEALEDDAEKSVQCEGAEKYSEKKKVDVLFSLEEIDDDKSLLDTKNFTDKTKCTVKIVNEKCSSQDKKIGNDFFVTESDKTKTLKDKITKTVIGLKSIYEDIGFMDKPKLKESTTVGKGIIADSLIEIRDFKCTSDKVLIGSNCTSISAESLHIHVDNSNNLFDEKIETESSIKTAETIRESLLENINITEKGEMEPTEIERSSLVLEDENIDIGLNLGLVKGEKNWNERKSIHMDENIDLKEFVNGNEMIADPTVSGENLVKMLFRECVSSNVDNVRSSAELSNAKIYKDGSKRQISRLEKLLGDIRNEIEKVQEQDLSLDSLEEIDSCYIYEDKLKRKFVKVWEKLCQLKNRDYTTGRPAERRFHYNGTRYEEVNKKIEKFINRNRIFPDYHDIKTIVSRLNNKHNLFLGKGAVDDLAREVFADVGNQLQQRRHEDFICTFRSRLTDDYQPSLDPALFDIDLRKKLEENRKISQTRLDEVIDKYANKQYEMGLEPQEVREVESSVSEDDEEEENIDVPELEEEDEDCLEEAFEDNPERNLLDPVKIENKPESSREESKGRDISSYGIDYYEPKHWALLKSSSVENNSRRNIDYCQTDLSKSSALTSFYENINGNVDCYQSDYISQPKSSPSSFTLDNTSYGNTDFYHNHSHLKTSSLLSYKHTTFKNTDYCRSKNYFQPKSSLLSFNKQSILFGNSVSKSEDQPKEKSSKVIIDLDSAEDPVVLDDDEINEFSHNPKESMCCSLGLNPRKAKINQNFNLKQEDGICLKIASVTSLACLRTMRKNPLSFCHGAYNSNYKRNLSSASYEERSSTITSGTEIIVLSDSD